MSRGLRDRRYFHGLRERFGILPASFEQTAPGAVWLHAVSVGEVLAAAELVRRIKAALPGVRVFVSTATLAGRETADRAFGGDVFFAPLDYRFAVRCALRRLKPAVVIVMETEIWPNLYGEARRFGCGLLVVNGRISDRAFRRYLRWRWFFRRALSHPDVILAQDAAAAERYRALGARNAIEAGNLKYDFDPDAARAPEDLERWLAGARTVWIAASTMPPAYPGDVDEDDAVIDAFRRLAEAHPELLLILVPRKPERFEAAARKLAAAGIAFVRRSKLEGSARVLLLDSIGELSGLFRFADVVFMGGTLAARGGHNVLEPGAFGKPVIVGPHMENFAEIAAGFEDAGALCRVADPSQLAAAVEELLSDPERRRAMGQAAYRESARRRGATARAAREVLELHARAVFAEPPGVPRRALSYAWIAGAAWKRRRDTARQKALECPVISVGNLSMGGTGKTPFVLWLARRLHAEGLRPAILTRGYRRRSAERTTVFAPGLPAPAALTGDEAQIYVRAGIAPVGVAADRFAAGERLMREFRPGVLILDDGFQHWKLRRNADIVLVDVLDPFSSGVFPAGRLREPESALARAGAFVLTRTEPGRAYEGIVQRLHRWNPSAPVFLSRVVPGPWKTLDGREAELPPGRAGAFCGLANPAAFWRSLDAAGVRTEWRRAFPDHHRYTRREMAALASNADYLLTTQKDSINLPGGIAVPVFWLEIDVHVDEEAALIEFLRKTLVRAVAR